VELRVRVRVGWSVQSGVEVLNANWMSPRAFELFPEAFEEVEDLWRTGHHAVLQSRAGQRLSEIERSDRVPHSDQRILSLRLSLPIILWVYPLKCVSSCSDEWRVVVEVG
jgi:hypothetical protein